MYNYYKTFLNGYRLSIDILKLSGYHLSYILYHCSYILQSSDQPSTKDAMPHQPLGEPLEPASNLHTEIGDGIEVASHRHSGSTERSIMYTYPQNRTVQSSITNRTPSPPTHDVINTDVTYSVIHTDLHSDVINDIPRDDVINNDVNDKSETFASEDFLSIMVEKENDTDNDNGSKRFTLIEDTGMSLMCPKIRHKSIPGKLTRGRRLGIHGLCIRGTRKQTSVAKSSTRSLRVRTNKLKVV